MINSLSVVVYTALFVIPGYVYHRVVGAFGTQRAEPIERLVPYYVLFSVANFVVLNTLLSIFGVAYGADLSHAPFDWRLLVITMPGPLICGLLMGIGVRNDWLYRAMCWLKLRPLHPVTSAWDYAFSRLPQCWIRAWLEDGSQVRGELAEGSIFASDDPDERDLLLIRTFCDGQDGNWGVPAWPSSVWVRADQVTRVEFFMKDEEDTDEQV